MIQNDPFPLSGSWLGGFLAVMTYRIIGHLRFRKQMLWESEEIREGHIYDLYLCLLKEPPEGRRSEAISEMSKRHSRYNRGTNSSVCHVQKGK